MAKLVFNSAISQEDGAVYELYWNTTSSKLGIRKIAATAAGKAPVTVTDTEITSA
jgi:hypothetical protein